MVSWLRQACEKADAPWKIKICDVRGRMRGTSGEVRAGDAWAHLGYQNEDPSPFPGIFERHDRLLQVGQPGLDSPRAMVKAPDGPSEVEAVRLIARVLNTLWNESRAPGAPSMVRLVQIELEKAQREAVILRDAIDNLLDELERNHTEVEDLRQTRDELQGMVDSLQAQLRKERKNKRVIAGIAIALSALGQYIVGPAIAGVTQAIATDAGTSVEQQAKKMVEACQSLGFTIGVDVQHVAVKADVATSSAEFGGD